MLGNMSEERRSDWPNLGRFEHLMMIADYNPLNKNRTRWIHADIIYIHIYTRMKEQKALSRSRMSNNKRRRKDGNITV